MSILEAGVLRIKEESSHFWDLNQLNMFTSTEKIQGHNKNLASSKLCPFQKNARLRPSSWDVFEWSSCAKSIIRSLLNCTAEMCNSHLNGQFKYMHYSSISSHDFVLSHGSEFHEIKYTLFYRIDKHQNMYALLSPFSLIGWGIILTCFFMTEFVLWQSKVKFGPYFWLFGVLVEQGDDLRSQLSRVNINVILIWLYSTLILRTAYTSNLYTFMTKMLNPYHLPNSFEEIIERNVVLLSSPSVSKIQQGFVHAVEQDGFSNNTKKYQLTVSTLQKQWSMQYLYRAGPFRHFRTQENGDYEICKLEGNCRFGCDIDTKSCTKPNKFAYMFASGPIIDESSYMFQSGKLLLMMNLIGLEISENSDASVFHVGRFFVAKSENAFRSKFETYLAYIIEAGIDVLQNKYITEFGMKLLATEYIKEYAKQVHDTTNAFVNSRLSDKTVSHFISVWMQNKCFNIFSKDKCDLNFQKGLETPVALSDFIVVWILLLSLLMSSVLAFSCEYFRKRTGFQTTLI